MHPALHHRRLPPLSSAQCYIRSRPGTAIGSHSRGGHGTHALDPVGTFHFAHVAADPPQLNVPPHRADRTPPLLSVLTGHHHCCPCDLACASGGLSCQQSTVTWQPATGNNQQATCNNLQATGNNKQATGNNPQATGTRQHSRPEVQRVPDLTWPGTTQHTASRSKASVNVLPRHVQLEQHCPCAVVATPAMHSL
jgi:hypothetical protein